MQSMLLRVYLSKPFEIINMWTKMSIMVTHGTWMIGLNILLIPWWSRVGIFLLLLRRRCRRLVHVWLVLL